MPMKNRVKNQPNAPNVTAHSTQVGTYTRQSKGSRSCESEVTTMLKRSSHIPTLMAMQMVMSSGVLCRMRRQMSRMGPPQLQVTMVQNTGA